MGIRRADLQGEIKNTASELFVIYPKEVLKSPACVGREGEGWEKGVWELIGMRFENEMKFRNCG